MTRRLTGVWLGRRRYGEVHAWMQALHAERRAGERGDTVLLLEHETVITLGRGAAWPNVLLSRAELSRRGVDVEEVGRGGDVTLHAPGQLVCYPVLDLAPDRRDVRRYVGDLTETMRRLAADYGVAAGPVPGLIGVWVDADTPGHWPGHESAQRLAKLGAVGVRISRWVTMHGFAINLSTDLSLFGMIVPCGISQHGVTSIAALTGQAEPVSAAGQRALGHLAAILEAEVAELQDRSESALPALPESAA